MKIRISNKYNEQTSSFDKALYDIRESDKTVSGRFKMSKKDGEEWVSNTMAFIAFKNEIDHQTLSALVNHSGNAIRVSGELSLEITKDKKGYFRFIIKEARIDEPKKAVVHFQEKVEEENDEIPF